MAGNTRGKLKECLEGIHRNCEWSQQHCLKSLALIQDQNPKLTASITALGRLVATLDEFAQQVYATI